MVSIRRIKEVLDTEPAMTFKNEAEEDLEGSLVFWPCDFYLSDRYRAHAQG